MLFWGQKVIDLRHLAVPNAGMKHAIICEQVVLQSSELMAMVFTRSTVYSGENLHSQAQGHNVIISLSTCV